MHGQAGAGGGGADQVDHDLVTGHARGLSPRLSPGKFRRKATHHQTTLCTHITGYTFFVGIVFADIADRHGIARADALHAVTNAEAIEEVPGVPGEPTKVFVGHPHPQTDRYIEVIAAFTRHGDIRIFHVMELGDLYRDLVE